MTLFQGNYLGGRDKTESGWGIVTIVEYVGEFGECRLKTMAENTLPFKPLWYGASLRGYVQAAEVPDGVKLDMTDAVTRWNIRLPENGVVGFYETREERDSYLQGNGEDES